MEHSKFLSYLADELHQYRQIVDTKTEEKNEKRHFINGLMTSARFFGISYESLQHVIDNQLKQHINELTNADTGELLDVPAFIRQNITLDF
ncbi:hypothetical protein L4C54_01605 [Vibrio lamellibrachiae]|uniref:hypothetical protein n=1 Tax=Vibrio lamellibrachiae TaxID=2910253 RepID=UPI003D0C6652